MKMMKKLFAIALVAAMVMALCVTALAEGDPLADGSIQITPPTGVDASATNTYTIYKVFNATNNGTAISYTIDATNGELTQAMENAGFSVDTAGNVSGPTELTTAAIDAIAAYATHKVAEVTATGTAPATATGLGAGYYYITTSTGTLVTIDSTNPSAAVIDKNTVPGLDKKATGETKIDEAGKKAIAEVGKNVNFDATITVGKGMESYVFHDTMTAGLQYNNDITITAKDKDDTTVDMKDKYTVKANPDEGDTITVTFADGLAEGTVITITYSAKVTSDALTVNAAKNTATVSYGDNNTHNSTPVSEVQVYNAKFTVTKHDGENQPLAGAGFVIKNSSGAYYFLAADKKSITWYTLPSGEKLADAIANGTVTEYKSDDTGAVQAFTGLADGTYTLEESTVPAGYNKAADQTFTVTKSEATTNLEQAATVTNKKGTELPSTGGIGTKIFYGVGAVLVIGAGVVLMGRKRAAD